jgi:hypothetical protein
MFGIEVGLCRMSSAQHVRRAGDVVVFIKVECNKYFSISNYGGEAGYITCTNVQNAPKPETVLNVRYGNRGNHGNVTHCVVIVEKFINVAKMKTFSSPSFPLWHRHAILGFVVQAS